MIYPLAGEVAADRAPVRVPVAVACRVLGVLRELREGDPEGGRRVLSEYVTGLGPQVSERRVWRLCRLRGDPIDDHRPQASVPEGGLSRAR